MEMEGEMEMEMEVEVKVEVEMEKVYRRLGMRSWLVSGLIPQLQSRCCLSGLLWRQCSDAPLARRLGRAAQRSDCFAHSPIHRRWRLSMAPHAKHDHHPPVLSLNSPLPPHHRCTSSL